VITRCVLSWYWVLGVGLTMRVRLRVGMKGVRRGLGDDAGLVPLQVWGRLDAATYS
jgi:hypothetical protein